MTNQNENPLPLLPDPLEVQPAQLPITTPVKLFPEHNLRHISWRTVALVVVALVVVAGFLVYAGGFEVLSRIFGSKAGTETSYILAGLPNLEGNSNADDWIVPSGAETVNGEVIDWPGAVFDGTGAFSSFTKEPDYMVPNALEAGFVMPVVSSLTADTFANHRYTSPAINMGTTGVLMNSITIYAYLPETAVVNFGYRTSDAKESSNTSELHELSDLTFATVPTNENIKSVTVNLDQAVKQYLRMYVDFSSFEVTDRPVVYGWVIEYGQTPDASSGPIVSTSDTATLTLDFGVSPQVPVDASLKLLCTDIELNPVYSQDGIDLSLTNGEYTLPLKLRAGSYTLVVTSSTTKELIVPFEATGEDVQTVSLGAFEVGQSNNGGNIGDLNNDGVINGMDIQILLGLYGEGS